MQARRRHDADDVELLLGQHPLHALEATGAPAGGGAGDGSRVRIGDRDELGLVDDLVPDPDVVATHHPQAHHAGAQGAVRRIGHPAVAASSEPSSAAVSLTAPMTVAISSSVSDGWTGMLSTCSVSRSVTG